MNSDTIDRYINAVESLNLKYDLHLDAQKVLRKIGGRRPGKHCVGKAGGKGSYISAEKQCKGHKSEDGKLTDAGKVSARELANKVRARKGMKSIMENTKDKKLEFPALKGSEKQVEWANSLRVEPCQEVLAAVESAPPEYPKRQEQIDAVHAFIGSKTKASDWIDHRKSLPAWIKNGALEVLGR